MAEIPVRRILYGWQRRLITGLTLFVVVSMSLLLFLSLDRSLFSTQECILLEKTFYQNEISSLDHQIAIQLNRLQQTPACYIKTADSLSESIETMREQKATYSHALGKLAGSFTIRDYLPTIIAFVSLCVCLFVSIILFLPKNRTNRRASGLGKMVKTTSVEVGQHLSMSYTRPISPQEFLEVAKEGADLPFLNGRDKTAKKLGINSYEAKKLIKELKKEGRVIVVGKRLKIRSLE